MQPLWKIETIEFIGHPLYSNCTAPSEFRPPPEASECRRFLTLRVPDSHRRLSKNV